MGDKPTSIGDESNQVGQMTSHTETKRDVLTDGYNGGEILVSEATNVLTKEEAERRAKRSVGTEIQAIMRSMRTQEGCCLCEGCVRRKHDRETKRSTEDIVDSIANKIERVTWPEHMGKIKVVFTQQRPKKRERDKARKQLTYTELRECNIRFVSERDRGNEVTVLPDARHFIFGFTPRDGDPTARTGSRLVRKLSVQNKDRDQTGRWGGARARATQTK